jgi:hypothetical protein
LAFGEFSISAEEGVQQGDPLGPLLFCLVIHPILVKLKCPFKVAYLDDLTISGTANNVIQDLSFIERESEACGLHLNLSKCEAISANATALQSVLDYNPAISVTDIKEATLLGTALSFDITASLVDEKLGFLKNMQMRISSLPSHDALFLLRNAMAIPRLTYLLRSAPAFACDNLVSFDLVVREMLCSILNVNLTDSQWKQANLPVKWSGLGIRSAVMLAPSAFLASNAGTMELVKNILPENFSHYQGNDPDALSKWRVFSGDEDVLPEQSLIAKQSAWDVICVKYALLSLQNEQVSNSDHARLLASTEKGSGDWLFAPAISSLSLRMSDDTIRIAASIRLGAIVCQPHEIGRASCRERV